MKINKKNVVVVSFLVLLFGITGTVWAIGSPTTVNLATAGNYVILAKSGITTTGATAITGDIAVSPAAATTMTGFGLVMDSSNTFSTSSKVNGKVYASNYTTPTPSDLTTAVTAMESAYTDAIGRAGPTATEVDSGILNSGTTPFVAGIYKWSTDVTVTNSITLSGSSTDVWIFQISGDLTLASAGDIASGTKILLSGGAKASNVFWAVHGAVNGVTLGTFSTFNGNILSLTQIAMQNGAVLNGRALSQTQVTLIGNTISATAPASFHVIKHVVNDNGGTALASAFNVHVKFTGFGDVSGSPALGVESPGTAYTLSAGNYTVSEDVNPLYTSTFSGDCDASGNITLAIGGSGVCTITNDDSAPSLHLRNVVVNNNNGTASDTSWTLTATGASGSPTNLSGTTPVDSGATFKADTYTLNASGPSGYDTSAWVCVGGVQSGATITLSGVTSVTCTITNDDIAPTRNGGSGGGSYTYTPPVVTVTNTATGTATAFTITTPVATQFTQTIPVPYFPNTGFPPEENTFSHFFLNIFYFLKNI